MQGTPANWRMLVGAGWQGRAKIGFRKDGRMVFYRLSDGFPHALLEHCLRQLLTIAAPEGDR